MSPASKPVDEPKMLPAATLEDNKKLMEGTMEDEPIVMGHPPFSSPDPETDGVRMLPLEEGTSAAGARGEGQTTTPTADFTDYSSLKTDELKRLAEQRELDVTRTDGGEGNLRKEDYVAALTQDDTRDMKAADWKDRISNAQTVADLDTIASAYEESGVEYSSVQAALDKRYEEVENSDQ